MKKYSVIRVSVLGIALLCGNKVGFPQGWNPPDFLPKSGDGTIGWATIASDTFGNLHVVWDQWTVTETDTNSDLYYSTGDGTLWSDPTQITNTPTISTYPKIIVDRYNTLHLFWLEWLGPSSLKRPTDIFYSYSEGGTWSTPLRLTQTSDSLSIGRVFNIALNQTNQIYVVWFGGSLKFKYLWGSKGSWSPIFEGKKGQVPDLFINSGDTIHFSYQGPGDVFYAFLPDGGSSWSDSVVVYGDSGYSFFPKIVVDELQGIQIVWMEDFDANLFPEDLFYSSSSNRVEWTQAVNITNSGGTVFLHSIALDTTNNLNVVWGEASQRDALNATDIFYTSWDGTSWSPKVDVSNRNSPCHRPQIIVDQENCLHLVWRDDSIAGSRILYSKKCLTTGVEEEGRSPILRTNLDPIHPNPFSSIILFTFSLEKDSEIKMTIYDITGRLIETLFESRLASGNHVLQWEGLDETGKKVPSGIYFYRFTVRGLDSLILYTRTMKMILLR